MNLTLNEKPPDATHWSERTMAARAGIAPSSVHKIWAAHGLKPHLTKTFKLSRNPNFVAKVEDIVGLYLNPPTRPWCWRSMKKAKSRPLTAPSRACR